MNGNSFYDWFCGVLPLLNKNSVIIMDKAPYHSVKKDSIPTMTWKENEKVQWLQDKNVVHDMTMVKMQ